MATTITPLPPAPSRTDPATFSDKSDALLGALATFVSETNTVAGEVNANAAAAATQAGLATTNGAAQVALATTQATNAASSAGSAASSAAASAASANMLGNWSALTGALNMPASVAHAGKIWTLVANLADVTAATPGVSASWLAVPLLQYTLLDTAGQSVTAPAGYCTVDITAPAGSFILLPDATTLTKGFAYELKITNTVYLKPSGAANPLTTAFTTGIWRLFLSDNSTAAGTWVYTPVVASTTSGVGNVLSATVTIAATNSALAPQINTVALDSDRTLLIYHTQGAASGTAGVWAVILSCPDVSASTAPVITVGTPVLISGTNTGTNATYANTVECVAVNTELFAVVWNSAASAATDSAPVVVMVSTSGMTVTAGAVSALHASETQSHMMYSGVRVCSPTTNTFVVAYSNATASSVYARVCTVSGTTITLGAETTVASSLGYTAEQPRAVGIVAHSSNTVVIGYNNVTAAFGKLIAATFSGTTLTFGTAVNSSQTGGGYYINEVVYLSATSGWVTNAVKSAAYTLAGTTITVGTEVSSINGGLTVAVSATKVFQLNQTNGGTSYHWTISGTTISAGSPATLVTTGNHNPRSARWISGNALYSGVPNDSVVIDTPTFATRTPWTRAITGNGRYALNLTASTGAALTAVATQYPTTTILN